MSNAYVNAAKKLKVGKDGTKNPVAKSILLFLADAANDDGFCFPGIAYIADVLELGESTVRKQLNYLDAEEFIIKKRIKKNNGYQMNFSPTKPKTPLRDSGNENSTSLPQSGEKPSHRYQREFSPLPGVTATTERINITLKGFKTSDKPFNDLNGAWLTILGKIESKLNPQIFDSWFRFMKVEKIEDKTITVSATQINQHWVLTYYSDILSEALGDYKLVWNVFDKEEAA